MTQDWHHYAIYDHPKDYPEDFVVRRWRIVEGSLNPVPDETPFARATSLREARAAIPPGLVHLHRHPEDDPVLVETWV